MDLASKIIVEGVDDREVVINLKRPLTIWEAHDVFAKLGKCALYMVPGEDLVRVSFYS